MLGKERVRTAPSDLEHYGRDWTRVHSPAPLCVLFPSSTQDVVKILKYCNRVGLGIVPSGGRTGLAGGAVASQGEVVLSLEKMNRMGEVNPAARTVRVQAGAVTQAVQEHCAPYGLTWPVDFASKGSSQIGGNIATNAGGVRVIRYGLTRDWVLGLEVVTAEGEVLELNGELEKNNTGYDLKQLFIGSEGTLGVITEAVLKLTPRTGPSEVLLFGIKSLPEVLEVFANAQKQPFIINAFEFFGKNCLESVLSHRTLRAPLELSTPYYVLLEIEKGGGPTAEGGAESDSNSSSGSSELEEWLASLFESGKVLDGRLAQTAQEAEEIWALREGISESLSACGLVHKHDIALPISSLPSFVQELLSDVKKTYGNYEVFLFGHIGDGNLHINTVKPDRVSIAAFLSDCRKMDQKIFELIRKYRGSVSAEHGIGLLKKEALPYSRSEAEIEIFRQIKKALDPKGILNPGKIFELN